MTKEFGCAGLHSELHLDEISQDCAQDTTQTTPWPERGLRLGSRPLQGHPPGLGKNADGALQSNEWAAAGLEGKCLCVRAPVSVCALDSRAGAALQVATPGVKRTDSSREDSERPF